MSFPYLIGQYAANKPAKVLQRPHSVVDRSAPPTLKREIAPYSPIDEGAVIIVWNGTLARQTGRQPAECHR